MIVLELFSGTESFSKEARKYGFETVTVDDNRNFNPTIVSDILDVDINKLPMADIIWASPPCRTFSVSSIGKHWNMDNTPKTPQCVVGLEILDKTIEIISVIEPMYWVIENPRGKMRKVIDDMFDKYGIINYRRESVTYCQYGDTRMKPTDLWVSGFEWTPKPMCKNGDTCHERAPRGSKSGTQGLKNRICKSIVPNELCTEILQHILLNK